MGTLEQRSSQALIPGGIMVRSRSLVWLVLFGAPAFGVIEVHAASGRSWFVRAEVGDPVSYP